MRIKYCVAILAALLITHPVFADDMDSDSKPCKPIVKSCLDAGYKQKNEESKQFWQDCMKPVLMGKSVDGVTVNAKDVKACRDAKIKEKQQEIEMLKLAH